MKLVELSIKRPVGVIMIVSLALLLGVVSLRGLVVDLFPDIDVPVAAVVTSYEGASPEEMEELVTKPIEEALGSLEGVDTIQSISQPNSSLVILLFDYGIDIDQALNDIRVKLDQVSSFLPSDANTPTVLKMDPQAIPIMAISLTGESLDKLQTIADEEIKPMLERIEGVGSVTVMGGIEREIRVNLDKDKLAHYGITGGQVVQVIGAENRAVSAGTVKRGSQDLQLRIDGQYSTVEEIEKTLIPLPDGSSIQVRDVADVVDTFKDQQRISRVNGEDVLMLTILKRTGANTVQVADRLNKTIDKANEELAERNLQLTPILDTSIYIKDSINAVVNNMLVGGVLAVFVLLLFLRNIRSTFIIGVSIPISLIATFTLMYFMDMSINIITMAGLALGLGLLIDSSIVILENIFKKRTEGMSVREAALVGGSELGPAIIASTTTTAAVFLPIVFADGLAAQLFQPLALTVVFALTMSSVCALTLIPMMSSKMLGNVKVQLETDESTHFVDRILYKLRTFYGNVLERALGMRKRIVAVVSVLFFGSFLLVPVLGMELMPSADSGEVVIEAKLQVGSQLEETELVAEEILQRLEPYESIIKTNYVTIGGSSNAGPVQTSDTHITSFNITLVDASEREMTTDEFIAAVDEAIHDLGIPGVEVTVKQNDGGFSTGNPILISIYGDDLDVLDDIAQQVVWMLEEIEGTMNVTSTSEEGRPEVQVVVDRELANQFGLSYNDVMNEISLAFNGQVATRFKEGGSEYDVRVMLPDDETETIRHLETMTLRNNQGVEIPLTAIASLKQTQGPVAINRENQQRGVQVTSDVHGRDLGSVYSDIQRQIEKMTLPDGYSIDIGGDTEEMMESFGQLLIALVVGIFLIYMVMAVQFESFAHPLVIMFSVPTMIIGAVLGLFVTNLPLSLPAFIGLIMLAGIVVNNGIILVESINILRRAGVERFQAVVEAGKSRLRPILMTTLTTALAMFPLALGIGEGAETNQPLAIVIIFGLFSSTVFTLVFVPVMYIIIDHIAQRMKRLFTRKKADDVEAIEG